MRQYTADFEPAAPQPFDDLWERKLTSVQQVKGELSSVLNLIEQNQFIPTFPLYPNRIVNRGNAQVYRRAVANRSSSTMHQSSISSF